MNPDDIDPEALRELFWAALPIILLCGLILL